jgi:hypothetical protein
VEHFPKIAKWTSIALAILLVVVGIGLVRARTTWQRRTEIDCPVLARVLAVPHTPISPDDYIEVLRLTGWGGEPIRIRIYSDGRVERDTTYVAVNGYVAGCPLREADKHLQIPPKVAVDLLSRARDKGFCRLCGIYRSSDVTYDAGYTNISLKLAGKVKSVGDDAGTPPPLFGELFDSVWDLSPMDELSSPRTFSPDRKNDCLAFRDHQEALHPELK